MKKMIIFLAIIVIFSSGCATMIRGKEQAIPVKSNPPGAQVKFNDIQIGYTPMTLHVARKANLPVVRIESDGYKPWEIRLQSTFAPWAMLNLIFGPFALFGVIPDLINSANYTFTDEEISVTLVRIPSNQPHQEQK